jgi:hypothetical protein
MFTATFYKIANRWHLDAPAYLEMDGHPDDLEAVGGLHELLERLAEGGSSVRMALHTAPFEGAEEAVLVGSSGDRTGAYYQLPAFRGQVVELELWVNAFIYRCYPALPLKIYMKPV